MAGSAIETVPIGFLSKDGTTHIKGKIWTVAGNETPRAIVQLLHGMSEYIDRYDEFARFLAGEGFVVCGHDYVGHGYSVSNADQLGSLPIKNGKDVLIEDAHEMRRIVAGRYPQATPYFIFGHSMGSFVGYLYISRHAEGLAGAVLCGTGRVPASTAAMGKKLASVIAKLKGVEYRSKLLWGMAEGSYGKRIENARTPLDWLNTDPDAVDAYIADPLCGAMFSAGGYVTLMDMCHEIATPECAAKVPTDLPVLFIAGDQDPVGDFTEGVKVAEKLLVDSGQSDVRTIFYEGMRHEILNEPGRERVFSDVKGWLEERL